MGAEDTQAVEAVVEYSDGFGGPSAVVGGRSGGGGGGGCACDCCGCCDACGSAGSAGCSAAGAWDDADCGGGGCWRDPCTIAGGRNASWAWPLWRRNHQRGHPISSAGMFVVIVVVVVVVVAIAVIAVVLEVVVVVAMEEAVADADADRLLAWSVAGGSGPVVGTVCDGLGSDRPSQDSYRASG